MYVNDDVTVRVNINLIVKKNYTQWGKTWGLCVCLCRYLQADPEHFDLQDLKTKFDVILLEPPLEEYYRESGISHTERFWTWDDVCMHVDQIGAGMQIKIHGRSHLKDKSIWYRHGYAKPQPFSNMNCRQCTVNQVWSLPCYTCITGKEIILVRCALTGWNCHLCISRGRTQL